MNDAPAAAPEPWARRARLWGMIHVLPSPAAPGHPGMGVARARAVQDAKSLRQAGFDGLILENMHDFPPIREAEMGPEVAAYMTSLALAVRAEVGTDFPLGIQVLFAAHQTAVAVAQVAGLQVVRVEAWTHAHVADKGWVEASAGRTLRYAHVLGAGNLEFWADLKKKHASHAVTADLEITDVAATLPLHGAHAAVITGRTTGDPPDPEDFDRVRRVTSLPLVLGSGLTVQNAPDWAGRADAFIVGTALKEGADWRRPVDPGRAKALAEALVPRSPA